MSDQVFVFICTRSTYPLHVPAFAMNAAEHYRDTSNAFQAIAGGFRRVGDLVFRPKSVAFDDHLLCDGSTIQRSVFPQLVDYLAGIGASSATLPNYLTGLTFATEAPAQTIGDGGTVVIGTPAPTPTPAPGQTGGSGGNTTSGGRPRNPGEAIP